jgi:hypothetical protein
MTVDRVVIIAGKRVAGPPPTPAARSFFRTQRGAAIVVSS